jgi:hypothetical protein
MASVNLKSGRPCSAMNCWPSSSKVAGDNGSLASRPGVFEGLQAEDFGVLEDGNVDVIASSALLSKT